jgi:hypothetical protein
MSEHTTDRDCDNTMLEDVCQVCGVVRGEPCPECGGMGYHNGGCGESCDRELQQEASA